MNEIKKNISCFETNVAHFENQTGDKILYPFGPSIFQTEVDSNFTKQLIEQGRKLTKEEDNWSPHLAGNLKYGRSYHYKKDFTKTAEAYIGSYVQRYLNSIEERYGGGQKNYENKSPVSKFLEIQTNTGEMKTGTLKLDTLWINFSQKHDFNPPHTHYGALSFVIFCKVPDRIFEVQADTNTKRAGELIFSYGENISSLMSSEYPIRPYENLMLIFPNELKHYVSPYWVDEERISVSGNFVVV